MHQRISLKFSEILFLLAWILLLISWIFGLAIISIDNEILIVFSEFLRYFAYFLCIVKIVNMKIKQTIVIPIVLISIIFAISYVKTKSGLILFYSLILLASMSVDGNKIIKITGWIQGAFLVIIVNLSQLGLIQDYIFESSSRIRHGLGFVWTNTGTSLYFYFMLCVIYVKKEEFKIIHSVILEIINLWFYRMTDSRMLFFLSSCFLLFFAIQGLNKIKWKLLSKFNFVFIVFPFGMFLFTLIIYKFYDNNNIIWSSLNRILSNRLSLGSNAINKYGFSLFGQNIEWIGFGIYRPTIEKAAGYNYVDSSYLQLLLNYGFIFTFLLMLVYSYAIYKAVKLKNYYLVMIYLFVLIIALTEPKLLNFVYNPFPLLAFCDINPHMPTVSTTNGHCNKTEIKLSTI